MKHESGIFTASSTVVLPLRADERAGHTTSMPDQRLKGVIRRIDKRLEALGISASQASLKAELSRDAIRNIKRAASGESDRRGVTTHTIERLAKALETTSAWLLEGTGDEAADSDQRRHTVRLVGYVGAGAEAHFYAVSQGDLDEVPAPIGWTSDTRAVEIRGNSLGELFDRWIVYYDDVRSPVTPDLHGRLCVVGLADERVLIKKIRAGKKRGLYTLLSEREKPIEDVAVEWAARVRSMVPR
jgi:transcriptional regulator with XRE-family HTH domain